MPNQLRIMYPALRNTTDGFEYISDARTHRKWRLNPNDTEVSWTRIYGGKVTENIVQALARIVVAEQMVSIGQTYHVAFQVHDEIIIVVPAEGRQRHNNLLRKGCLLLRNGLANCQWHASRVGINYGDAK